MKSRQTTLCLILASIYFILTVPFFAKNSNAAAVDTSPTTTPVYVQYDLAFPGVLPDHPLNKLKVARDKLRVFLTRDINKRVRYYLLLADKGILAAAMLVDKGNIDLAGHTALKAEHNMTMITTYLNWLKLKTDPELIPTLKTASLKHQEVLLSLIQRIPQDKQQPFQNVLEFSKRNLQTIEQFETEVQ